jgi:hypothetical protein
VRAGVEAEPNVLHMYLYTSDRGSDQGLLRKIMKLECHNDPSVLVVDFDCLMHQAQLAIKDGLVLIDRHLDRAACEFKYFSSIAKIINCWRESARSVFVQWINAHGNVSALACARKVPPRAVSGRWGSMSSAESFLLAAGGDLIVPVLTAVLTKTIAKSVKPIHDDNSAAATNDPDELRVEEQQAYSAKMGRWRRDVLQTIACRFFWAIVASVHFCREPYDHFLRWLQVPLDQEARLEHGGHLAQLQAHKAQAITDEFVERFQPCEVFDNICDQAGDHRQMCLAMSLELLLNHFSQFHRRVSKPLRMQHGRINLSN